MASVHACLRLMVVEYWQDDELKKDQNFPFRMSSKRSNQEIKHKMSKEIINYFFAHFLF